MLPIIQNGPDVLIALKVVPKSSRDQIVGTLGDALKVTVSAAPERGAANQAVCKLIAKTLGIRAQQVTVEAGHGSPRKTVRIRNASVSDVQQIIVPARPA